MLADAIAAGGEFTEDELYAAMSRAGLPDDVADHAYKFTQIAWGHGVAITDRAVDTHVFNLRKKIEPVPAEPRFLVGVRGIGYRFISAAVTKP